MVGRPRRAFVKPGSSGMGFKTGLEAVLLMSGAGKPETGRLQAS